MSLEKFLNTIFFIKFFVKHFCQCRHHRIIFTPVLEQRSIRLGLLYISGDVDMIEQVLKEYENQLQKSIEKINEINTEKVKLPDNYTEQER